MTNWRVVNEICEVADPCVASDQKKALMLSACREMAEFHYHHCREVRFIYERWGFEPAMLVEYSDLAKIPPIGVSAMKRFVLTSLAEEQAVLKLTSSGTKGIKTQIWFDQDSLERVQRMLDVFLEAEGFVSNQKTNYLIFNYDPDDAGDLGVAFTDKNQMRFAPVNQVHFTVKKQKNGEWFFNKERALATLKEYAASTLPVRIFGMPAFIHEFAQHCVKVGASFQLASGSLMITGGGWKASEEKRISRAAFRQECEDIFGIDQSRQRDAFGMAEHSAPYFECKQHKFHVPVYNRLLVRDPETMQVLAPGQLGLMELITPFNAMMPTLALLTTDWVSEDQRPCACGYNTPTFTLMGRAGISQHKGCAIHADDIVKRKARD